MVTVMTLNRLSTLQNSILANESIIKSNPEFKEDLENKNDEMRKEIESIRNPSVKIKQGVIVEPSKDLGWNCIATQKNGTPCQSKRKHGKYCGRHLVHYVKELEAKYEC